MSQFDRMACTGRSPLSPTLHPKYSVLRNRGIFPLPPARPVYWHLKEERRLIKARKQAAAALREFQSKRLEGQRKEDDKRKEEDNIRISGSGKSVVIPDAFVNYYVEMDILEDYLPVAQNGYDGVISISDIQTYIKGWNVLEDGEEFEA